MNEEDRELLKGILAGIKEVSQKLDKLTADFGSLPRYTVSVDPTPYPYAEIWDGEQGRRYPYEFPTTTGGQP